MPVCSCWGAGCRVPLPAYPALQFGCCLSIRAARSILDSRCRFLRGGTRRIPAEARPGGMVRGNSNPLQTDMTALNRRTRFTEWLFGHMGRFVARQPVLQKNCALLTVSSELTAPNTYESGQETKKATWKISAEPFRGF